MKTLPLTRDLVLIGGGHTHALVLHQWGMNPLPGVRLTVINPGPTAPYSGMLPGFVAGHYSRDALDIDLVKLARFAGARIINGAASAIDRDAQMVSISGHGMIGYDILSVDIGITSAMPALPGFSDYAIPAKPLGQFAARWDRFRKDAIDPHVVVIGGGVAGAELAMAMAYALRQKSPHITLIDRSDVLTHLGRSARRKVLAAIKALNVTIMTEAEIARIGPKSVTLSDDWSVRSDFTTGAAGAKPYDWINDIGLKLHDGFIIVDKTLRSSDPQIFAVGDCAHLGFDPRPKAGVFAVRQAPVLFDNLRAALSGGKTRRYKPQKDYLKLISLGGKSALAEKFGTAQEGPLLWRLKDYIDQSFMNQFDDLTMMETPDLPTPVADGVAEALGDKPLCGGCGAKVGRARLAEIAGDSFGDDAAMLQPGQVMTTDHLRGFTHDVRLMARITATHALGDIWAMGAQPQGATINIILPRMSDPLQERSLREIMDGARAVMDEGGCDILGGHTSVGEELTIGFTLTGRVKQPITLSGAKPGHALILTKPLGSGTILAAEMQGKARGDDVMNCYQQMIQGQAAASTILGKALAMTDVTGFGLLGHLRGICDASQTGAKIHRANVPIMTGARALCDTGIRSSIYAANMRDAAAVAGESDPLFYDPQTAGGLLAAVEAQQAPALLAKLHAAGYSAAIIGSITEDPTIRMT